jgi:hypothetical protein
MDEKRRHDDEAQVEQKDAVQGQPPVDPHVQVKHGVQA